MKQMKLVCWNVNGIRAVIKKGFFDWLRQESPDILCLQETKIQQDQLTADLKEMNGYHTCWNFPDKKGYSGVATLSKEKPLRVQNGFGLDEFDREGRMIVSEHPGFVLFNVYFPNGKMSDERLKYKMDFYEAFQECARQYRSRGHKLIICGDVNTAHREIDLARPKENEKNTGFLPDERAWIDRFLADGFIDTFRLMCDEPGHYSWWDYKTRARERNVGWRIDYFFVSEDLKKQVKNAWILSDVPGSDHCPVGLSVAL